MDNIETIRKYLQKCKGEGINERTRKNTKNCLGLFFDWKKDKEITEDLLLDYLDYLDEHKYKVRGIEHKYTESSKYQMKSVLKKFVDKQHPDIKNPIKSKVPKRSLPKALIDENDVEMLISSCLHPRDSAMISFMYESGCRKGEMFSLKLDSVMFDDMGAVVTFPEGKTGSRRIRLVYSASFLHTWLLSHPRKDDNNAPLFCSLRTPDQPISESGLHNQLQDLAARAGIKKRIYPHLFRHSRATHLAQHLTESEMKTFLGWTAGSSMAATYVHLSGERIDPAIFRMYGIQTPEETKSDLTVTRCYRCKELNPETSLYCGKCGLPLHDAIKTKIESDTAEIDMEIIKAALLNPAILEEIAKRINKKE